jgi:glycosyltransferase involved in cell wall biosynthesis
VAQRARRRAQPESGGNRCPLCSSEESVYVFLNRGIPVYRCLSCDLTRLRPELAVERSALSEFRQVSDPETETDAAAKCLQLLETEGVRSSAMLLVTQAGHPFAALAEQRGHRIGAQMDITELVQRPLPTDVHDCAVVIYQLERSPDPLEALEVIHRTLVPDGVLLLVMPALDSTSARLFRQYWPGWRPENLYSFSAKTVHGALLRTGFRQVRCAPERRVYSLQRLHDHTADSSGALARAVATLLTKVVPERLRRNIRLEFPPSGQIVLARAAERLDGPLVSIVMPVYNERKSFGATMEAVLGQAVPGAEKEVIIVESNSTDGTRELVRAYEQRPGVRVLYQAQARGKGHAVRAGLAVARGDVVLIQDADEEYDVRDYPAILKPVLQYRQAFVLGSRHVGDWKIRSFNDQPGVTAFFNLGHLMFVFLLNRLYGQRLKDPFTMYKVFWRDCLFDIDLECDRFDFDFELVIKLIRKGYSPVEIPVNYNARSFQDGKKVSAFRDPITWIRALLKYRFVSIYRNPSGSRRAVDRRSIPEGDARSIPEPGR